MFFLRIQFMYRILLSILLLISHHAVIAQFKSPAINSWRVHLNYASPIALASVGNNIYCGGSGGLFIYDIDDNSTEVLSRVNGLSDVSVKCLAADNTTNTVVIVYDNSNIDLIQDGNIYNIPSILNQIIVGEKRINDITVHEGMAYLATSFGIVKIDLQTRRITDSYQNIGESGNVLPVNDIAFYNGSIYAAATTGGLFRASINAANLADFTFWNKFDTGTFRQLTPYQNNLYLSKNNVLFRFDGIQFDSIPGIATGQSIVQLKVNADKLISIASNRVSVLSGATILKTLNEAGLADAELTKQGDIATALNLQGLVIFGTGSPRYIIPDGPASNSAVKFAYSTQQKRLFVAGGIVNGLGGSAGWRTSYNNSLFYSYDGKSWLSASNQRNSFPILNKLFDVMDIAINERTRQTFLTSFGGGVIELNETTPIQLYDTSNSKLGFFVNEIPTFRPVLAAGSAIDNNGTLWVTCYNAARPISARTSAGVWYDFPLPAGIDKQLGYMLTHQVRAGTNKWILNTTGRGLYVFNEGARIDLDFDDSFTTLTTEKGKGFLPSNNVLSMALDQRGTLWIGTDKGLCFISNPGAVFTNGDYDARQIIFNTGSFNSIFLGTEAILCIKVDGANRKWIGTQNGVWLVSEDGYTVIRNFTTKNSPLLSDKVYDIGIFEETGEVFFATEKGIISYAGDATKAGLQHGQVIVYPNPVEPGYNGDIVIRGLIQDANVKITDIAGNLVFETKSNGGTATWNGNTFNGKRASTGVYLIYSSNEDATETHVTKLLLVN